MQTLKKNAASLHHYLQQKAIIVERESIKWLKLETLINWSHFHTKNEKIKRESKCKSISIYIVYVSSLSWRWQTQNARANAVTCEQTDRANDRTYARSLGYRRYEKGQLVISILRHRMNEWFVFVRKLQQDTQYPQMHM